MVSLLPFKRGRAVRSFVSALALVVLGVLLCGGAQAHEGDGPSVDIEPSTARPGVVMRVIGEDFPPSTPVELLVTTSDGDVVVGNATSDAVGHFATEFTAPASFAPRAYELRAQTSVSPPATALITVLATDEGVAPWVLLAGVTAGVIAIGAAVARWRNGARRPPVARAD